MAAAIMALISGDSAKVAGELWDALRERHGETCIKEAAEALLDLLKSSGPGAAASHANAISALAGPVHCEWDRLEDQIGNAENLTDWILRNTERRDVMDATYLDAWDIAEEALWSVIEMIYYSLDEAESQGREAEASKYLSSLLEIALKETTGRSGLARRAVDMCAKYISHASDGDISVLAAQAVELLKRGDFSHEALKIIRELFPHGLTPVDIRPLIVQVGGLPLLVSHLNPLTRPEVRKEVTQGRDYNATSTLTGSAVVVLAGLLEEESACKALEGLSGDFCERLIGLIDAVDAEKQPMTCAALLSLLGAAAGGVPRIANKLRHMGALTKIKGLLGIRYSCDYDSDVVAEASGALRSLMESQDGIDDALGGGLLQTLVSHLEDAKELTAKACATQATYGSDWLPYCCPPADEAGRQAFTASQTREAVFECLNAILQGGDEDIRSTKAKAVVDAGILPLLIEFLAENDLKTFGWIALGRICEAGDDFSSALDQSRIANAVIKGLQSVPKLLNGARSRNLWSVAKCCCKLLSNRVMWCLHVAHACFSSDCDELTDRGLVPALVAAINATVSSIPVDTTLSMEVTFSNRGLVLKELLEASYLMSVSAMSESSKTSLFLQLIRGGTAALLIAWGNSTFANGASTLHCKAFTGALWKEVMEATVSPGLLLSMTPPEILDSAMVGLAAATAVSAPDVLNDLLKRPGFSTAVAKALLCGNRQGKIARLVFSEQYQTARQPEEGPEPQRASGAVLIAQDHKRKDPESCNSSVQEGSSRVKRHCAIRREEFNVESSDTLKLVVGGKPFYGHGVVLMAASETLRVALQDVDPSPVAIPLGDGPASVPKERLHGLFCAAWEHAYFGAVPGLSLEGPVPVMELREVARWLQMPELLEECNRCVAAALHKAETAESASPIVEALFEELISEGVLPPVYKGDIGVKARGAPRSCYFVPGGPLAHVFVGALLRWGNDERVAKILVEGMGGGLDKPRKARCVALLSEALGGLDGFQGVTHSKLKWGVLQ